MRSRAAAPLALAAALALASVACERPEVGTVALDRSQIAVHDEQLTLRTDAIGVDQFASQATFALVTAENLGDAPAEVTLGGVLVDADGREVGALRAESLRIPARGKRVFALIDRDRKPRPTATGARVDVRGARVPRFEDPVRITDGHVYRDKGPPGPDGVPVERVVVAGKVHNPSDRAVVAIVLASFHDASGKPLTRPYAAFELGGKASRPTRFVGPPGSTTGQIYVGDIVFCPRSGCEVERRQQQLW